MRYRFLRFPEGKGKAVTFSYDDGVRQDIRFSDTLTKYNMKGTFNLNSFSLRGNHGISPEEVKEHILDAGHEVATHGFFHRAPGVISPMATMKETIDCRLELEKTFGRIIRGMAYPDCGITRFANGSDYQKVREILNHCGIVYSRTLGGDNNSFLLPTDWLAWMPTIHHDNPNAFKYIEEFLNIDLSPSAYLAARHPRLFYIWGHSYEFDNNNNWERLDEICKALGGKEDVWYATNIEIYEYVKAYDSLIFSADEKTVYNPSLQKVWFDIDGKAYSAASGEIITI